MNIGSGIFPVASWLAYTKTKRELESQRRFSCSIGGKSQDELHSVATFQRTEEDSEERNSEVSGRSMKSPLKTSVSELKESVEKLKRNFQNSSLCGTSSSTPDLPSGSRLYTGAHRDSFSLLQSSKPPIPHSTEITSGKVSDHAASKKPTPTHENAPETLHDSSREEVRPLLHFDRNKDMPKPISSESEERIPRKRCEKCSAPLGHSAESAEEKLFYLRVTIFAGAYQSFDSPSTVLSIGKVATTRAKYRGRALIGGFRLFSTAERAMSAELLLGVGKKITLMRVRVNEIAAALHQEVVATSVLPVDVIPLVAVATLQKARSME